MSQQKPDIIIDNYELKTVNCSDRVTARALAVERLHNLEQRLKEIKSEKRFLNSQKHILTRWLSKTATNRP